MKHRAGGAIRCGAVAALFVRLALLPGWAGAAPPSRTLCVDLREAGAGGADGATGTDTAGGWQVGSADARVAREQPPRRLCMQNGERAAMNFDVTRPVQVWQTAPGVVLPVPVPTTQWVPAGQHVAVRARWGGGREPVQLEIDAGASRFDPSVAAGSSEAPSRAEAGVQTTLRVPLDTWVTIASAGGDTDGKGLVSTQQARAGYRLQVRVSVAP